LVGGRLAPFYIHQMNRVNSRMALPWWQHHRHCSKILHPNYPIIFAQLC